MLSRRLGGVLLAAMLLLSGTFAATAQNLAAPKELADALLGALADDGGLLDEASPQLARLRNRLRAHGRLPRVAHGARAFVELLQEIDRFDLARLKEGPLRS